MLLESVRTNRPSSVVTTLARYSEQPSIQRAAIYAAKSGLLQEAAALQAYLTPEPPIYHLSVEQKSRYKEELREARNRKLGRRKLGEKFYVYMHQNKPADMLYVVAHGEELSSRGEFQHTGDYQLGFMAPEGHVLSTNHIRAFLENRFTPKDIIRPGQQVKEHRLSKNYNSGWAFKIMQSDCNRGREDLMERKAAPVVISTVREHFATTGKSVDFLTVRGRKAVILSNLLHEINQASWATSP